MKRFSPTVGRVAASLAIAVGLVLIFLGVNASVTGSDGQKLPNQIEDIQPLRNATQAPAQGQVQVDLVEGYTGTLTINGVEIETVDLSDVSDDGQPGEQVTIPKVTIFEPGNDTLTFTPSDDAPIESFDTGVNTVRVVYWKITDGPNYSKSFTWQFDVV